MSLIDVVLEALSTVILLHIVALDYFNSGAGNEFKYGTLTSEEIMTVS